jgi:SAM-dependent methyltransferase
MCLADKPWLIRELLDLPYLPSPQTAIDAALDHISLGEGEFFADLGCGEGNVLISAAERFNAFCVGFEIDDRLLPMAKRSVKKAELGGKIDVVHADLFTVDLSRFDAIYAYPFPTIAQRLSEKLRDECRKGTTALICDYALPLLNPAETVQVPENNVRQHWIYIYKF